MVGAKKKTSKKKPVARKKTTTKKKATARKKTARKKTASSNVQAAASSRHALTEKLKEDLATTKNTLKLAKKAAQDEIAVLKDQLNAALKREKQLRKISEKKIKKMLIAGERWEKKQLVNIKKATEKAMRKVKKK